MNRIGLFVIAAALSWGTSIPQRAEARDLSAEGEKVVTELLDQWVARFRSTDIATAMGNLGMESDDKLRLEIGEHLRANRSLARPLRQWGANNFILTGDEKRIAKYLISVYEETDRMPTLEALSEAIGLPSDDIKARLDFMAEAGLLEIGEGDGLGFSLVEEYDAWGGPLRYNFHSVAAEGVKPFGVW